MGQPIASVDSNVSTAGGINPMATLTIRNRFARLRGLELELPSRSDTPSAPDLVKAYPRFTHQQRERQNS